jgi:hypothetical protein
VPRAWRQNASPPPTAEQGVQGWQQPLVLQISPWLHPALVSHRRQAVQQPATHISPELSHPRLEQHGFAQGLLHGVA